MNTKEWENTKGSDRTWQLQELVGSYKLTAHAEKLTYFYNKDGRIEEIADRNGNTTKFQYGGEKLSSLKLACGQSVTFSYENNLLMALHLSDRRKITYEDGISVNFGYDERENLIYEKDRNNNETHRTYDVYGNITEERKPSRPKNGFWKKTHEAG